VVGGVVTHFGGNACPGKGREIVIEADESDASFLKFSPALEIITNLEEEHMDHYKTIERVEAAYREFIGRLPAGNRWIGCGEDLRILALAAQNIRPCLLYGFDEARCEIYATDLRECPDGRRGVSFVAWQGKERLGEVTLRLIGRHNALNALAAVSASRILGIPFDKTAAALGKYEGAGRRFDVKHEDADYLVADDYGHHPTEIRKTLAAARAIGRKRLVAVFQPHRFTRTRDFMAEFGRSFVDADEVIITDVYAAGEEPIESASGQRVRDAVVSSGHRSVRHVERARVKDELLNGLKSGDLVLILGAGDIFHVADELASAIKARRVAGHFQTLRGKVLYGEPMARHTTLKIGGGAECWIEPADESDLSAALEEAAASRLRVTVFGAGSNLLAPDKGLEGAAIHLGSPYFKEIRQEGDLVVARAGVPNTLFIQYALERGLGGCEFLSGIPGNIGGAVAMNAGSHGQSVDGVLEWIAVTGFDGTKKKLKKEEVPFRYRSSGLKDAVVTEAAFRLPTKSWTETQKTLDDYRDYRAKTQDLWHASAGCMFKNPVDPPLSAGKLIDEAGLKGLRIGSAQVSEKHANFIINLGGAKAADVRRLIESVRNAVKEKSGVTLDVEVKIL
jgi:UDP-N-acetylenolpyruvoylglucosamine reductase